MKDFLLELIGLPLIFVVLFGIALLPAALCYLIEFVLKALAS